jgi:hypothetical protein
LRLAQPRSGSWFPWPHHMWGRLMHPKRAWEACGYQRHWHQRQMWHPCSGVRHFPLTSRHESSPPRIVMAPLPIRTWNLGVSLRIWTRWPKPNRWHTKEFIMAATTRRRLHGTNVDRFHRAEPQQHCCACMPCYSEHITPAPLSSRCQASTMVSLTCALARFISQMPNCCRILIVITPHSHCGECSQCDPC